VVPALQSLTWQTVLYGLRSLTVIRMLPVAVALAGAGLGQPAVLFVGWFGPRGLASVVFGLLALEDVTGSAAKPAVTVITFTVLLSVLAHGLSASPLAKRYGPRLTPPPETAAPPGPATVRPSQLPGINGPASTHRISLAGCLSLGRRTTGTRVTGDSWPLAQPFRMGPELIRAGFHTSGRAWANTSAAADSSSLRSRLAGPVASSRDHQSWPGCGPR
jgi:hypothetical protein